MALGETIVFYDTKHQMMLAGHNFSTHVFKAALVTSAVTPAVGNADPNVGAALPGGTDFADNEVSGTGYARQTLANLSVSSPGATVTFDYDDFSFTDNPSGPTDCRWCIVYNDSHADKRAVFAIDLGSSLSLQAGPINIESPTGGLTI